MGKHQFDYTQSALEDLTFLKPYAHRLVLDAVDQQLVYEPTVETRNRKQLEDNPLATWELHIGIYRIFYDVDTEHQAIAIIAVGYKEHNKLYIRGKEYKL